MRKGSVPNSREDLHDARKKVYNRNCRRKEGASKKKLPPKIGHKEIAGRKNVPTHGRREG